MHAHPDALNEEFARLLDRREAALSQALQSLAADDEPVALQEVSDFKEIALRSSEAARDEPQARRLQQSMAGVVHARQRLASGSYGHCMRCGQAVDLRRLRALPEAELCMDCQRLADAAR